MVIVRNTTNKKGAEKNPRRACESKKSRALRAARSKKKSIDSGNAYSRFIDAIERSTKF